MNKGDILLVPFPFSDLSQTKFRPAIVLWVDTRGKDLTLCFISSQNTKVLRLGEFLLESSTSDFTATGLKISSKVIVTKITTIERKLATRRLGRLTSPQIAQLNLAMVEAFQLKSELTGSQK